jgi:ABC-type multidrug transport system fused ATPase/permease subunit
MQPARGVRLWRILGFLRPYWKTALFVLALTLAVASLNSVEPLVQKFIFDSVAKYITAPPGSDHRRFILCAIIGLMLLALLRELVSAGSNYLSWRLRLQTNYKLLDAAVGRIYNLSLGCHQNQTIGSLLTRLDRGINGFSTVLFDLSFNLLPSFLYLGSTLILMLYLNWRLSVVALLFAPLPAIVGVYAGRIASQRERRLMARWMEIYSRFNEALTSIKTVKSFAMEDSEHARFLGEVNRTNSMVARGVRVDCLFGSSKNIIMALGRIAVMGYGAYLTLQGQVTIGTLVAFLGYINGLFNPMLGLAGLYETLQKAKVYLDTIFEIIDTPPKIQDCEDAISMDSVEGQVEFEAVSFGYSQDRLVLKNVSFCAKPGSIVALVGPSGAGKTTIVDLICRFYDPLSGYVRIDGIDIKKMTQKSLRKHIGMVLQDTALFNDTIKNNIAYARPDATVEEIVAAAEAANAHCFIERLAEGYETKVGERAAFLSGGERQRIAIARTILKNPAIFIFDEASSQLDSESEMLIQEAVQRLILGKTAFIIAHRLSTIVNADLILVVKDGQILEQGNHEQLVRRRGLYHRLVSFQSIPLVG